MYFYFMVEDNNWVDFQLDCGDPIFVVPVTGATTPSTLALTRLRRKIIRPPHILRAMAGPSRVPNISCVLAVRKPPTTFRYNFYDINWDGVAGGNAIFMAGLYVCDAASQFAFLIKLFLPASRIIVFRNGAFPGVRWKPEQKPSGRDSAEGSDISDIWLQRC